MGDYEKKIALIITKDTMIAQRHSQNFKPQIHQKKYDPTKKKKKKKSFKNTKNSKIYTLIAATYF